ncbi:alpha/beta fold hydrolase [Bradyrhizobium archetypum]
MGEYAGIVTGVSESAHWIPVWFSISFKTSRMAGRAVHKSRGPCIRCPTLVLGGEGDPMHPIESQADIAAALPPHLVQFERFADCGHGVVPDAPERALALIRNFILRG